MSKFEIVRNALITTYFFSWGVAVYAAVVFFFSRPAFEAIIYSLLAFGAAFLTTIVIIKLAVFMDGQKIAPETLQTQTETAEHEVEEERDEPVMEFRKAA